MSDEIKQVDPLDVLDTPCGDIDTSMPKLQYDRLYTLEIRKCEVVGKKGASAGETVLVVQLCTTKDEMGQDGKTIHKGYPGIIHRIGLSPTPNRDMARIAQDISSLVQATELVTQKVTPRMIIQEPTRLKGMFLGVKTKMVPAANGFDESVGAKVFVPAAKMAATPA